MTSEAQRRELADLLRTRRAKLQPTDVGISFTGRRRGRGLRREDIAQLAGISVTWYTWLEQARPITISPSVAQSLARALQLTDSETEHLLNLSGYHAPKQSIQVVSDTDNIHLLVENLDTPALLLNYRWDILAWNYLAGAIFGELSALEGPQRNVIRLLYEFPHLMPVTFEEQDGARPLLSHFRAQVTQYISRPDIQRFLSELLDRSDPFRAWWSIHDVDKTAVSRIGFVHPHVGGVVVLMSSLAAAEGLGLQLYVPSSARDACKLRKIASASLRSVPCQAACCRARRAPQNALVLDPGPQPVQQGRVGHIAPLPSGAHRRRGVTRVSGDLLESAATGGFGLSEGEARHVSRFPLAANHECRVIVELKLASPGADLRSAVSD